MPVAMNPHINRERKISYFVLPKPRSNQHIYNKYLLFFSWRERENTMNLTTETMAKQFVIIRLLPMRVVIHRKIRAENTLPIGAIEAIHETSSNDSGPVVSGVSSDFSKGKTGVSQPTMHPCDKDIKLTAKCKSVMSNSPHQSFDIITRQDCWILMSKMSHWHIRWIWFRPHFDLQRKSFCSHSLSNTNGNCEGMLRHIWRHAWWICIYQIIAGHNSLRFALYLTINFWTDLFEM